MASMRPIRYNCKIWKDIPFERAYFIRDIRNALNENFSLSNYGHGLSWFQVFAVIDPRNFHEPFFYHNKEENGISIQLKLDYENILNASEKEYQQIATLSYLRAIDQLAEFSLKGFNTQQYRTDVENLFETQGWLVKVV